MLPMPTTPADTTMSLAHHDEARGVDAACAEGRVTPVHVTPVAPIPPAPLQTQLGARCEPALRLLLCM